MSETELWTNPDSTVKQATLTIPLSDSIDHYTYICFRYNAMTDQTTYPGEILVTPDALRLSTSGSSVSNYHPIVTVVVRSTSNTVYFRRILYTNDTTIDLTSPIMSGSTSTNNSYCIVTAIIGLK